MILFVLDIDDTLTRSESQHQTAYVEAMKARGIVDIDQHWKGYTHHTDSYILKENFLRNKSTPFSFSFIEEFEPTMLAFLRELKPVHAIEGALDALEAMREQGVGVCMATGSLLEPAFLKLKQAGIPYEPELVAASNRLFSRESIVENAIERAKAAYEVEGFDRIVSVGDGLWDLKTARNLGLEFIGIGNKNIVDFQRESCAHHMVDWTSFDLTLWLNNNQ